MRTLAVNTFISLDGVMQSPGGPDEDPTGGFELGGWGVNYFDDSMMEQDRRVRSRTSCCSAAGPTRSSPPTGRTTRVRSRTSSTRPASTSPRRRSTKAEWNNSTVIEGDVAEYVAELKQQDGPEIQVHGSPGLIQTLLEHDLIDEYRLWIFPVVVGAGKRFFGEGTVPGAMRLVNSKVTKTGVIVTSYERTGEIDTGSFEFDEPTEAELERRKSLAA